MKQAVCLAVICSIGLIVDSNSVRGFDAKQEGWIEGLGYREQELQVAKGTLFASEDANGIPYASFGGGTNIFIKGVEFADDPQSNLVIFACEQTFQTEVIGPKLTEDDAFQSNPAAGFFLYRLSAPDKILGLKTFMLDKIDTLTVSIHVISIMSSEPKVRTCKEADRCKITFFRSYSPVLHYITPQVVYFDSMTEVNFDAKNIMQVIRDLKAEEKPFINTKIAGSLLDFEFEVDADQRIYSHGHNRLAGRVGDQPVAKDQAVNMLWETGNAVKPQSVLKTCSYDDTDCYEARTVPVIFDISQRKSFLTGGQNLTVTGFGFDSKAIDVKLDGVNCVVTRSMPEKFHCTVQTKAEVSAAEGPFSGSHGVRRRYWNFTKDERGNIWDNYKNLPPKYETLHTNLESLRENEGDYFVNDYTGWFVAPAATRYRFYMSCDRRCEFKLGKTPGATNDMEQLIYSDSPSAKARYYWDHNPDWEAPKRISDWVTLEKDQSYYLYARHSEYMGHGNFDIAVEIEQTAVANHHNKMRVVQKFTVATEATQESWQLKITNPDDGDFRLVLTDPVTQKKTPTGLIKANSSADQLRHELYKNPTGFYFWRRGLGHHLLLVTKEMDAATNTAIYTVTLPYHQDGPGVSAIRVLAGTSKSQIVTIDPVALGKVGGPPLKGKYRVQCKVEGSEAIAYSAPISLTDNDYTIQSAIGGHCPGLRNRIRVTSDLMEINHWTIGKQFRVEFWDITWDPALFAIESDPEDPLVGTNLRRDVVYEIAPTSNIFYQPIPYELLRTAETKPQLIVSVDGLPAACHNLTCDFTYIPTAGEVTAFTYTEATRVLTVTGTAFPELAAEVQTIDFALTRCTIDASKHTTTSMECKLDKEPTCGQHIPVVTSVYGVIPGAAALAKTTIGCTITNVVPTSGYNLLGGDNITFTGTNFPHELATSTITLVFSDSQATTCIPQTTETTKLVCLTNKFSAADVGATLTLAFTINGSTVTQAGAAPSMIMKSSIIATTSMTPASASPVLKTELVIVLGAAFPHALVRGDFTVNATSTHADTPNYVRYLNVIGVDDGAKALTVLFGGAESGDFLMSVRHSTYGLINCVAAAGGPLILNVGATVTSYTPQTGSIFGGTMLTITGTNFGKLPTDNPVSITHAAGPAVQCWVKSTMATTIKCRLETKNVVKATGDAGTMVTFLMTSEEAKCVAPACAWTYTDAISSVTAMTAAWDAAAQEYRLSLAGTGFTGASEADVTLEIGAVAQTTVSRTSTRVVFAITDIPTGKQGASILVFFPEGVPKGIADVQKGFDFAPKLSAIHPNIGSTAGTLITATVHGVGTLTPVGPGGLQLVDSTGGPICDDLKITGYSQVQCFQRGFAVKHVGMKCEVNENAVMDQYKSAQACYDYLQGVAPTMTYFHWRSQPNNVCASCPSAYDGSTTGLVDDAAKGNNVYYVAPTAKSAISVLQAGVTHACAATDATKCDFTQADATTMPVVTSQTKTDTTIVFTGANFQATLFPGGTGAGAQASFMGVEATSVVVDSATQATATWAKGVPTTSSATQIPKLYFVETNQYVASTGACTPKTRASVRSDAEAVAATGADKCAALCDAKPSCAAYHWITADTKCSLWTASDGVKGAGDAAATCQVKVNKPATIYAISTVALANAFSLTSSTTGLECSFAGGCKYEVQGSAGLSSLLEASPAHNYIKVCEKKCELIAADSTATAAWCQTPGVSTTYSNAEFGIEKQSPRLDSGKYFASDPAEAYKAFNNVLTDTVAYVDTAGCEVGMEFKAGYVGMITQAKVFLNEIARATTIARYVDKLEFQGSADGVTYTRLWRADATFHAGWNYIKFDAAVKHRFYRFSVPDGDTTSKGTCTLSEVALTGVEVIDDSNPTYDCPAVLVMEGETDKTLSSIKYKGAMTPAINEISPRFGTVVGGDVVTFTGINFVADHTKYSVVIDGINCPVSAATTTSVTCTTGKRPYLPPAALVITVDGVGLVSTRGLRYLYVNLWSADTTWGGEFQPMEGETVYIPKGLNLLVDVDRTPKLKAVLVEGSLLFMPHTDPAHQRSFDAMYVFVRGGYMEVGTKQFPYTSKLTLTMHGTAEDPYIPIYGNKVIGLRDGILEMHGVERVPAWTSMEKTSMPGDTTITLNTAVDWKVGEQIAIASTSYKGADADKRFIAAIDRTDASKPILTLDAPLEFKHFAARETFGASDFIEMRAEVALLTRNVVYRGDPETTEANTYGATMFFHSNGDDSLEARLWHIECTGMGQAFKLGRYAIHFHMIGAVHKSYAEGVVVHTSFNRAFTIHGTRYLRLTNNVAYHVKGHTVFIEDAVETENVMTNNLIFRTERSWSLLNTDQAPACFWITHPNNNFIGNHCGGSDRYAYWYDLQAHAMGPSANAAVCSEFSKVGIFKDNHAHSCGRYGLRIFHNMIPRAFPCSPVVQDYSEEKKDDPFWQNPAVTALFEGLVSWKNGRNGAITQRVGDVRFKDFKVADNNECGIEIGESSVFENTNQAQIDGALVIGKTSNTEYKLDNTSVHGIITGRSDYFQIKNVKFYNYNFGESAALGSCSHCGHDSETDSGARTVTFSGMYFDEATVPRRIWWQTPFRAIFYDLDGTLTEKGAKSWVTPHMKHHEQPGCVFDEAVKYGGSTRCDSTVTLRRLSFYKAIPKQTFELMGLFIAKYDDSIEALQAEDTKAAYLLEKSNYSTINWKQYERPMEAWTAPFVTGHKYKIHWGKVGLDWTDIKLEISDQYKPEDKSIYLVHNFTDVRAKFDIKLEGGELIEADSIADVEADQKPGQYRLFPGSPGELHFIANGRMTNRAKEARLLSFHAERCIGPCVKDVESGPAEATVRYWSNAASWAPKSIPVAGEDVMIEPEWNMELDVEGDTPIFKHVEIRGILRFRNSRPITLHAHRVFVNGGKFGIGSKEQPYLQNGGVTLHGGKSDEAMALQDVSLEAGSKIIANIGELKLFGRKRANKMTRLLADVAKGDTTITVAKGLDLVKGDKLGLVATSFDHRANDFSEVEAYNAQTGAVTLTAALKYYHYGAAETTGTYYAGADMRGEVLILSRNLKIQGDRESTGHGCQILTADIMTEEGTMVEGTTLIDSIEMVNCGVKDTENAAIRFQSAVANTHHVTNSAVWDCPGWCLSLLRSASITIDGTNFYGAWQIGVRVDATSGLTFNDNFIGAVRSRAQQLDADGMTPDRTSCVTLGTYDNVATVLTGIAVTNNIAGGCISYGFNAPGHECGQAEAQTTFRGNVAHSVGGGGNGIGAAIYPNPTVTATASTCFEASHFTAYKCEEMGIFSSYTSKKVIYNGIVAIDNVHGIAAQTVVAEADENTEFGSEIKNSKIFGDHAASLDCPPDKSFCSGHTKCGIFTSQNNANGPEKFHAAMMKHLPTWKAASGSGGWKARAIFRDNHFKGFLSKTQGGQKQGILKDNYKASDHIQMQEFIGTTLEDVDGEYFAYMTDPNPGWANLADCGNFVCTGPKNTMYKFTGNKYLGVAPMPEKTPDFLIIPDTPGYTDKFEGCVQKKEWNAYMCVGNADLGILLFESLDEDRWDRNVAPVDIQDAADPKRTNRLNAFQDYVWDGFYAGQKRLQRFVSIATGKTGTTYDVKMAGTVPHKLRFTFKGVQAGQGTMVVRVLYSNPGSRAITKAGVEIAYNAWDEALRAFGPLTRTAGCGENRYLGETNILEFYLTEGCELHVSPRDAIQTLVRMEWTVDQFFEEGGASNFAQRLAGSLGIHWSTVKVVSVYTGSLVVNYELAATAEEPLKLEELAARQTEGFATGIVSVGAPILDVAVTKPASLQPKGVAAVDQEPESLVRDGQVTAEGFPSVVLVATASNTYTKFLWEVVDAAVIATPSQIFTAFLKETMQFVLGKNFAKGYVMLDETASDGEASVVEL